MAYEDLLKDTSKPWPTDSNYFELTITDLNINTSYPIQIRWKYEDGSFGPWSAAKSITTNAESFPNNPSTLIVGNNTSGYLEIAWDGKDGSGNNLTNFDRVDVYIQGSPFDSSKPSISFFSAGKQTVVAPGGVYVISAYAVSKIGTISAMNTSVSRTVLDVGTPVQTPTLPSGLTVSSAPFAVSVNWPGTYSAGTFTGFKSIDIYAVGTDLGSTTTSGITSTNLVGSLTVNDTPNKINIGLDNLKQALSLSTTSDVYTATIYYYHNATNTNGDKYGSPTYTRINSSSVVPIKANYIDLASGVVSVENLVAGNGSFSSWLRTGTSGGARIELSAISDFTNGGNTVQKGLVAYSSGNTELFNLDLDAGSLTINGSGTFTGNLTAGSGNSIFKSDSSGIYLGNASFGSAPFSVSKSGYLTANSGSIAGWDFNNQTLSRTSNFQIHGVDGVIYVGPSSGNHLRISSAGIASYTSGSANGTLNLATNGTITATTGTFSGTLSGATGSFSGSVTTTNISATGGTIGGWTISPSGYIYSGSGDFFYPTAASAEWAFISTRGISSYRAIFGYSGATGETFYSVGDSAFGSSRQLTISDTGYLDASGDIRVRGDTGTTTLSVYGASGISGTGTIYANALGTTGSNGQGAIYQDSNGYLRVRTGTSSSIKIKENIEPFTEIENYSDLINKMNLVKFNFKPEIVIDPEIKQLGMIVEDLVKYTNNQFLIEYKNNEPSGIYYDKIPLFLIGAFKEISKKINTLEQRLDALEK